MLKRKRCYILISKLWFLELIFKAWYQITLGCSSSFCNINAVNNEEGYMKNLFWFENKRSSSTRLWCKKELMTSLTTNEFYFHMLLTMSMVSYQSFYLHHYHHWRQHHHHMISNIFSKGWNNTLFNFILLLLGTDTYRYVKIACVLTSVWSFVILFDIHMKCRVKLIIPFEIRIFKIKKRVILRVWVW